MGYVLSREGLDQVLQGLGTEYRLYAPVLKMGEGRFADTDVVRYDFVTSLDQIELSKKSDYAFKELLTPLSETLFFFTEGEVKVADKDVRDVIVLLRACDLHAVKRLDQMYLANGTEKDWFYQRIRDHVRFALIGCPSSFENCFCASMGTNVAPEGWVFSLEEADGGYRCAVADGTLAGLFAEHADAEADVEPAHVVENDTKVRVPENVPTAIYKHQMWDEYTVRCLHHRLPDLHLLYHAGRVLHRQRPRGRASPRGRELHDRRLYGRRRRRSVPPYGRRAHALQGAPQGARLPRALRLRHVRGLWSLRRYLPRIHLVRRVREQARRCGGRPREGGGRR